MDLDHVAVAVADVSEALSFAVSELGGTILFGGSWIGFRSMTIRLGTAGEGMNLELLEPWNTDQADFLERFVASRGDGPHHLTFKVEDIGHEMDRARAAGIEPMSVNLANPSWMEAFLHPRDAQGTVVQFAQTNDPWPPIGEMMRRVERDGAFGSPWWPFPPRRGPVRALLHRVVLRTPALVEAAGFFTSLLDGETEEESLERAQIVWPGGGRVALEWRPEEPAGIDRLELFHDGPPRERVVAGTRFVFLPRP